MSRLKNPENNKTSCEEGTHPHTLYHYQPQCHYWVRLDPSLLVEQTTEQQN